MTDPRNPIPPEVEAVARWLAKEAEYHEQNWRLYAIKARSVIDVYLKVKK